MSSFHVDARIDVKLEYELAVRLGEFIVNSGTVDKQIMALGYKLKNMDEENVAQAPQMTNRKWAGEVSDESSFASEWQEEEDRISNASLHDKVNSIKKRG